MISKTWGVAVLSLLVSGTIFLPALTGGWVMGTDAVELNIPQMTFYRSAFLSGESPFWNPYLAVGFPNFVSMAGFPFAPIYLFLYILPAITVHYLGIWLTLAAAFFFCVLFARSIGIGNWGSILSAAAYLAGNIHFARDLVLSTALFLQVILFWIAMRAHRSSSTKSFIGWTAAGSAVVGYGLLMTSYFPLLYIGTVLFAFILFLGIKKEKTGRSLAQMAAFLFLIFILGTLIGSLQIVPTYVMTQLSQRSSSFGHEGYALQLKDLFNFIRLTPDRGLDAYLYMGIAPLFLFIFSWFSRGAMINFFRWAFLIALSLSLAGSPLFGIIIKIPPFSFFQGAARFMLVGIFASSLLAGYGLDWLLRREEEIGKKLLGIAQYALFGLFTLLSLALVLNGKLSGLSVLISSAFLGAIVVVITIWWDQPQRLAAALMSLALIEGIVTFYRFNSDAFYPRNSYEKNTPTLDFVSYSGRGARILPLFVDDWDDIFFFNFLSQHKPPTNDWHYNLSIWLPTYRPNLQLLHGVPTLEANEPLLNVSIGRLMAFMGTRQLVTTGGEKKLDKIYLLNDAGDDISVREKYRLLSEWMPLANFLGITHFFTYLPFDHPNFNPQISKPLLGTWNLALETSSFYIPPLTIFVYENPTAKPPAYFSEISGFFENEDAVYDAFLKSGFNGVFVGCASCVFPKSASGKVVVDSIKNGYFLVQTEADGERFLVFTQNYLPGWKALIDGKPSDIFKVNGVFPGIFVPAGNHKIEFIYDYWSLFANLGKTI